MFGQFSSSYYYLHINKTGGSSLSSVISKSVPQNLICPAGLAKELVEIPSNALAEYRYFSGHFGLALPLRLPLIKRLRLSIFTLLRDPVDRSLSQINAFFRAKHNNFYSELVRSVRCDVDKCLCNDRLLQVLSNYQAKSLAVPVNLNRDFLINQCGGNFQEMLARNSKNLSEDELLDLAIKSIGKFRFVGLTEKIDESYRRLCKILNILPVSAIPSINVSAVNPLTGSANSLSRNDVSSAALRKLEEINSADIRLYERVLSAW